MQNCGSCKINLHIPKTEELIMDHLSKEAGNKDLPLFHSTQILLEQDL